MPGTVVTAQVLMWLRFAAVPCVLGSVAMVILLRMADVESGPITNGEAATMLLLSLGALLIPAAVMTLAGILAVKLRRGRPWARTATLVFNGFWIVLGLIASVIKPFTLGQPLLVIGFEGVIALCLCTPSAKAWFTNPHIASMSALGAARATERN